MSTSRRKLSRLPDYPEYRVTGLPKQIRQKTTLLMNASREYATIGMLPMEEREPCRLRLMQARYELEQTIMTLLTKKD